MIERYVVEIEYESENKLIPNNSDLICMELGKIPEFELAVIKVKIAKKSQSYTTHGIF